MAAPPVLSLFAGYGIELEYMIVDATSLQPLPICDRVFFDLTKKKTNELILGEVAWSNELARHVIELKANGPKDDLPALHREMQVAVSQMNAHLKKYSAMLLPTAMHPFFNPADGSLQLWQDDDSIIYNTYDRIFGCNGHGWGNVQATHLNLPFRGDEEFARLHSAVRLLLPLLPALAASSPFVEGKKGPFFDNRLHYYLANQRRFSTIIGDGIPEAISSKKEYESKILRPMYQQIAAFDTQGILQHEWLNSRAAIARFERNAVEIRILDIQECVAGDFALISAIVGALKKLCLAPGEDLSQQQGISQASLIAILQGALREGLNYAITDAEYLDVLNVNGRTIGEICASWIPENAAYRDTYMKILRRGNLAQEILRNCGESPEHQSLLATYSKIAECLEGDSLFGPS
jgi:gamma-glutamyl:cysteine ligase YbdK (ATP-grasp superfamily)